MTGIWRFSLLASVAGVGLAQSSSPFPDCVSGPLSENGVCDTSLDPVARAEALVAALTLDEKINNTQHDAPGTERLSLPAYNWWSEALHGVADSPGVDFAPEGDFSHATSFPMPINLGAAFDDALVKQVADVISVEARAFGNSGHSGLDFWTPNINPFKDPRWGRGQETPGEDALHTSRYVYRLIDGLQDGIGPDRPRIVASCKHFVGYDLEDWKDIDRHHFDAKVSSQDLSEYYMPPFKSCVRDAQVDSVMCSYNRLNGVPTCADPYVLQTILREHWGWEAPGHWVTSDCGAIEDIYLRHNYSSDAAHAAAAGLNAGTDLDCGTVYPEALGDALEQGLTTNKTLDNALTRLYTSLVKLGFFDPAEDQPHRSIGWEDVSTPDAEKLAHTAAVEGMVLLKNQDGILPLKKKQKEEEKESKGSNDGQTVALIGPYANATKQMQGNYEGVAPYIRTLQWAAEQKGYEVQFVPGTGIDSDDTDGFEDAVDAAQNADVAIYAGGIDKSVEAEAQDRTSISWPGNQLDLIQELAQVEDTPLIVLQFGGGQVDDSRLLSDDGVDALLWAGYPSQAGGAAVFDVLTGAVAPAGRLPVTQYPAEYTEQVPMTDMTLRKSADNPGRTYRWYNESVLPFGYGLHYTSFNVSSTTSGGGGGGGGGLGFDTTDDVRESTAVNLTVTNTGSVTSDYVALLFIVTHEAGPTPYPLQTLVGYTRAAQIEGGESRETVSVEVTREALARTSEKGDLVLYPGSYTLLVDVGQRQTEVGSFTLEGEEVVLDKFPQKEAE